MPVPDSAISISSPSDAPPGAAVVEGPRGGLYYLPGASGASTVAPDSGPDGPSGDAAAEARRAAVEELWPADGNAASGRAAISDHVADELGMRDVQFTSDTRERIVETATEMLRLQEADPEFFTGLNIFTDSKLVFGGSGSAGSEATGLYNDDRKALYITMSEDYPEKRRDAYEKGFLTTPDPRGTLWHELGHHRHTMNVQANRQPYTQPRTVHDRYVDFALIEFEGFDREYIEGGGEAGEVSERDATVKLQRHIREDVSKYAATSGNELVAEVHAGLIAGEEYSETTMRLYEALQGPPVGESIPAPSTLSQAHQRAVADGGERAVPDLDLPDDLPDFLRAEATYLHDTSTVLYGDMDGGRENAAASEDDPIYDRDGLAQPADLTDEERAFHRMHDEVIWREDGDRALLAYNRASVPESVRERLIESAQSGALFSQEFKTAPPRTSGAIKRFLVVSLEETEGWTINGLSARLQRAVPALSEQDAERIARTETQAVVNKARDLYYETTFENPEEELFKWIGPSDHRTTECCEWIKEHSRSGVRLAELRGLIEDGNQRFIDHDPREFTPHINCRHTYVRTT